MPSGFPGLTRVRPKPSQAGKAKAPPPTPPPSSPPPAPIPSCVKHNKDNFTGHSRAAPKPAAAASAPKRPAAVQSKPATRLASIEASSADEDIDLAAHVKAKKRKRSESIEEPASGDEEPAPDTISKKMRVLPPVTYDAEVIRQFEVVMECSTQGERIAHRVDHLHEAARLLPRMVGDGIAYVTVLSKGLAGEGRYSDDDPEAIDLVWNEYWEVQTYYDGIMKIFPGLEDNTAYLRQRPDFIKRLAAWMKKVAGKARSDDLDRIKDVILECTDIKDLKGLKEKTERGFKHHETARLLCPVTKLKKFDRNPDEFCRKVRNMDKHRQRVKGRKWPLVMYNMKLHVPGNPHAGFLRSDAMLHAFQTCFTGPSSAGKAAGRSGKARGKPPISRKLSWEGVNIVTIVYVAVLVRFALNDLSDYNTIDGDFIATDFVSSVLTCALRNPEWRDDLTSWYKRRVYGNQLCTDDEDTDSDDEPSSYELMMQGTEAARKAARQAARKPCTPRSPAATPEPAHLLPIVEDTVNEDTIDEPAGAEDPIEEDTAENDFFEQNSLKGDHFVKSKLVDDYSSDDEEENTA
ncbi:hypothetical protein TRAPUB_2243 [Trametes pubescens]|uniref:Uncharacterized protein n=1 Tax=Trametes pubescens TaxID=154538 RepID=A0A1M2VHB8_TRAPU|nr:hypothetical protein TRAPUB_2243 [Trametes pubescens]